MNLKEAFRMQNKLESLMDECCGIMSREPNVMQVETTYLRKKVMEGAENETLLEEAPSEYAAHINELMDFAGFLLAEKERLYEAILRAKEALPIDMDNQISLNSSRQRLAAIFRSMSEMRCSERVIANGGVGYRFNADGNQVSYKCDVRTVKTINFDRKKVRKVLMDLNKKADAMSTEIDRCMVTSVVDYEAPFDVNDTFADIFEMFMEQMGE